MRISDWSSDVCSSDLFTESMVAKERQRLAFRAVRDLPSVSRDGERISLFINAALMIDLPHLQEGGAEGIGLYRTEVPFMIRNSFPDVATQTEIYGGILDAAAGKPVVFRTLDVAETGRASGGEREGR